MGELSTQAFQLWAHAAIRMFASSRPPASGRKGTGLYSSISQQPRWTRLRRDRTSPKIVQRSKVPADGAAPVSLESPTRSRRQSTLREMPEFAFSALSPVAAKSYPVKNRSMGPTSTRNQDRQGALEAHDSSPSTGFQDRVVAGTEKGFELLPEERKLPCP
eukprot:CAMPEP_0172635006 /NCGR_PEP_ID=MMETSP1068-20121228/197128_1 /TAXON_ID=35684 /ORGANISM="Pseudopedinella elastica, Strain CCMP716" /LENGTH=160 /DNA_ID=CAMNT_0013447077 /DNA_START=229 /DNA_END=709 /DNA_ORIENTATION=+